MPGHRNAISFPKREITYVNINRQINVQQPRCNCSGGMNMSIWSNPMMLMQTVGLFSDFASSMVNMFGGRNQATQTPAGTTPETTTQAGTNPNETLKNLKTFYTNYTWIYQDGQFWGQDSKGNIIHGNTFDEIKDQIKPTGNNPDPQPTGGTGNGTVTTPGSEPAADGTGGADPKTNYGIEKESGDNVYTIKKGETWYSLAQTKYELPDGVTIKDVYTALAKLNYNGNDFTSAMKDGIVFMPGDNIKLPSELDINGTKVKLKSDWQTSDAATNEDFTSRSNYRSAKIQQVGDKWYITENGVRQNHAYDSESDARAALAELKGES